MNSRRLAIVLVLIIAFSVTPTILLADTWNQATTITFDQPVKIPGQVLPAGTYWFILADSSSNRNIVQIFSADRSVLFATLFTVPSQRFEASGRTLLTLAESPYGEQQAILKWFYPGETIGHEFIYSRHEKEELSRNLHQNLVTEPAESPTTEDGR
jgi:hypothetical protein